MTRRTVPLAVLLALTTLSTIIPQPVTPADPAPSPAAAPAATASAETVRTALAALEAMPEPLVETLPNGVRVVIQEHHAAPVAALRVFVTTGSMYEGEFLGCGISHYYEHLLSGGTTRTRTEEENRRILDEMGGNTNAYTTSDHTCYHIATTAAQLPLAIEVYADWMKNNILNPTEVEREKGVIVGEINMNEDEPDSLLWNLFSRTMYREHLLRIPVIGYRENFLRLTRDDLVNFYRNRYIPSNTIVAIAGDVDARATLEQVRKSFGNWEARPEVETPFPAEPPQTAFRRAEARMDIPMTFLMMGWHTADLFHPDLYPLDILDNVMSSGRSSRLVKELKEERGLVYGVSTGSWTPHFGAGSFQVSARLQDEHLEETIDAVIRAFDRAREEGITEEELARAKKQKIAHFVLNQQDAEEIASTIGSDLMGTGDATFSRRYVRRIQETTREDVQRVLRTYFDRSNLTCAAVRPKGDASASAAGASASAARPPIRKHDLAGGVRVLTREDPTSGVVALTAYWLAGSRAETPDTNGIGKMTATMLTRGTRTRSAEEIARTMDSLGGSLSPISGGNTMGLSLSVLSEDWEQGVEVFLDCLRNPTFPEAQVERARREVIGAIRNQQSDWQSLTQVALRQAHFTTHPYGLNPVGDEAVVSRLTSADLAAFHTRQLKGDRLVIAAFGGIDAKELVGKLSEGLTGLPEGGTPLAEQAVALARNPERHVRRTYGLQQVGLGWAYPGLSISDPDRCAMDILDAITSGVNLPGGWLHHALRGERDLVYTVHLVPFYGIDCGMVSILTQCTTEKRDEVVRIVNEQMARACAGRFTEEELRIARQVCITSHALEQQTPAQVANQVAIDELYGLGYAHHERYTAQIEAVTMEQIKSLAKRLFAEAILVEYAPGGTAPEGAAE